MKDAVKTIIVPLTQKLRLSMQNSSNRYNCSKLMSLVVGMLLKTSSLLMMASLTKSMALANN